MRTVTAVVLVITFLAATSDTAGQPPNGYQVLYQTHFAAGIDSGLDLHGATRNSLTVVADPSGGSKKVLQATMNKSDDFSKVANKAPRAEISFARKQRFQADKDYWISWSILLPKEYVLDVKQPEGISQIHQGPNIGTPPFGLSLVKGRYQVDLRSGNADDKAPEHHDIGSAEEDRGKWVSWSLHYRPDATGKTSISELFKNGKLVLRRNGVPNAYPDDNNAYFKMGVYKWWWITKPSDVAERTLYFGDVTFAVKK